MPDQTFAGSVGELLQRIERAARIDGDRLDITDEREFRERATRELAWAQTFSDDAATVEAARWIVGEASQRLGAPSSSIHELYVARGRGEVGGFTVPAINIRTQVFDMAAAVFRAAAGRAARALLFVLARGGEEDTLPP